MVERAYKKMKINFHLESRVEAVEKTPAGVQATIRTPKGEITIEANLAMMAAGQGGIELAHPPEIKQTIEPERALSDAFSETYDRYKKTYRALKELP